MSLKKKTNKIIDSRHLKIISVKRDELKNSITFITLDSEKFGLVDQNYLLQLAEIIEKQEPSGFYIPAAKSLGIEIYDKAELKNKSLIVKATDDDLDIAMRKEFESCFRKALADAKDIEFVYGNATIEVKQ